MAEQTVHASLSVKSSFQIGLPSISLHTHMPHTHSANGQRPRQPRQLPLLRCTSRQREWRRESVLAVGRCRIMSAIGAGEEERRTLPASKSKSERRTNIHTCSSTYAVIIKCCAPAYYIRTLHGISKKHVCSSLHPVCLFTSASPVGLEKVAHLA